MLNSINLVSSHKIVVTKAIVRVSAYNWEDDEICTAIDPGKYQEIRVTEYYFGFHYQDDVTYEGLIQGSGAIPLVHCREARTSVGSEQFWGRKAVYKK